MSHDGYFVITDITGYTAYLSQAELEHAHDILSDLMEAVLEATKPPLIISRLEGDAIFAYAPANAFLQGMTLVELLEKTYAAFRHTLRRIRLNTSCQCNACVNIPNLDLKTIVHSGEYTLQKIGDFTELLGNDVNMVFRLTKNNVREATGLSAYAAYTEPSVKMLGIESLAATMQTHHEAYEHVGEVTVYLQDLHSVWERRQHEHEVILEPGEALITIEADFPVEPAIAWEYLTDPQYRSTLLGSDRQEVADLVDGRVETGSTYICYHGDVTIRQTILDWHPFRYYTMRTPDLMVPVTAVATFALLPTDEGTRISWRTGQPEGRPRDVRRWQKMMRKDGQAIMGGLLNALKQRVVEDLADSKIKSSGETVRIPADDIRAAIRERLNAS